MKFQLLPYAAALATLIAAPVASKESAPLVGTAGSLKGVAFPQQVAQVIHVLKGQDNKNSMDSMDEDPKPKKEAEQKKTTLGPNEDPKKEKIPRDHKDPEPPPKEKPEEKKKTTKAPAPTPSPKKKEDSPPPPSMTPFASRGDMFREDMCRDNNLKRFEGNDRHWCISAWETTCAPDIMITKRDLRAREDDEDFCEWLGFLDEIRASSVSVKKARKNVSVKKARKNVRGGAKQHL